MELADEISFETFCDAYLASFRSFKSRFKEEIGAGIKTGIIRSIGGTGSVVTLAGVVFAAVDVVSPAAPPGPLVGVTHDVAPTLLAP